jgi:hypothetical protein
MRNDKAVARLWKLQTCVNKLILDGKRDPKAVCDIYQGILDGVSGRAYRLEDGVIHFSVTSPTPLVSGAEWPGRLESNGLLVGNGAKMVLCSSGFVPSKIRTVTEVAILPGLLFNDRSRVTSQIRSAAYCGTFTKNRRLFDPNAEVACFIHEKFTSDDLDAMGFWQIVVMHEPINDSYRSPVLLSVERDRGGNCLRATGGWPVCQWNFKTGFAFALSSTSVVDSVNSQISS